MRRLALLAAAAAVLAVAGAAQANAVVVNSTLDISQPQNADPFGGWRGFGAFSPSHTFDLSAGDSLTWTVDFKDSQELTLVNPTTLWLFNFETSGEAARVNATGTLELLDTSGAVLFASNLLTDTEGDAHFGQFFGPGDFSSLPNTVTFGGLRYTGTLNFYGAPDPHHEDPDDPNSPLIQDPTPSVRTYADPDFSFTADASRISGVGGVPEPATWALMISGFGLAGASLRRRRALAA